MPEPVPAIRSLRERALAVQGPDLGLSPTPERPRVWGALMDMGHQHALVTLLAFGDGTTSLYLGTGGGVIGAGEHETVRAAAAAFLLEVERHCSDLEPTTDTSLPKVGEIRFLARTFDGLRAGAATEPDLRGRKHPLAPLFFAGHRVITAIRETSESPPRED